MYIDGFVLAVRSDRKEQYLEVARQAAAVFKEHGATRVVECWGDDVPEGQVTSFPLAVKLEAGETALFSWIEYPDKETRERCMKASMEDPRLKMEPDQSMMDPKRMIYGGFQAILDT